MSSGARKHKLKFRASPWPCRAAKLMKKKWKFYSKGDGKEATTLFSNIFAKWHVPNLNIKLFEGFERRWCRDTAPTATTMESLGFFWLFRCLSCQFRGLFGCYSTLSFSTWTFKSRHTRIFKLPKSIRQTLSLDADRLSRRRGKRESSPLDGRLSKNSYLFGMTIIGRFHVSRCQVLCFHCHCFLRKERFSLRFSIFMVIKKLLFAVYFHFPVTALCRCVTISPSLCTVE